MGSNENGQLGRGDDIPQAVAPQDVPLPEGVRAIVAGAAHTCALADSGRTYCWGLWEGWSSSTPVEMPLPLFRFLRSSDFFTCGVGKHDGAVTCWGEVPPWAVGQDPLALPGSIPNLHDIVDLALGSHFACALSGTGELVCWGNPSELDAYASLADATARRDEPLWAMRRIASGVTRVAASGGQACAFWASGRSTCTRFLKPWALSAPSR